MFQVFGVQCESVLLNRNSDRNAERISLPFANEISDECREKFQRFPVGEIKEMAVEFFEDSDRKSRWLRKGLVRKTFSTADS